jgi:hypothetical protein
MHGFLDPWKKEIKAMVNIAATHGPANCSRLSITISYEH